MIEKGRRETAAIDGSVTIIKTRRGENAENFFASATFFFNFFRTK